MYYGETFRVVDLGVMTPCQKILDAAINEKAGKFNKYCLECGSSY